MIDLIHHEFANSDKVIIKKENKKHGQLMKEALNESFNKSFNAALYNGFKKDDIINDKCNIRYKIDDDKTIDVFLQRQLFNLSNH